jgi:membrane protein implicated in regulation of membrane protease activity
MAYGRSIPGIFSDLMSQLAGLMRSEAELARAETSEKISQFSMGFGLIITGAILLIPALVMLLEAAASALLTTGMATYWAELIVGGAAAITGLILALIGRSRFDASQLIPKKTIDRLQRDAGMLFPATETEGHLMGEASDRVKQVGVEQHGQVKEAATAALEQTPRSARESLEKHGHERRKI